LLIVFLRTQALGEFYDPAQSDMLEEEKSQEVRFCLTQSMDEMVLESQLPHKSVNLLLTITN